MPLPIRPVHSPPARSEKGARGVRPVTPLTTLRLACYSRTTSVQPEPLAMRRLMSHDWLTQVRDLTLTLVRCPSVTGTPGEREFAGYIRDVLAAHPYFRAYPEH